MRYSRSWWLTWRPGVLRSMGSQRVRYSWATELNWTECSCSVVWTFFGIGMKTDLFYSCGHCWVFRICWHIECSTFTASSFRVWNNSTKIPSPPRALFVVMLPKAHLTLHSRMSGSRWVITASWLSGSWRSFLYSSSVFSCHLFWITLLLLGAYCFCPSLCPSLHGMFPWYLWFSLREL